MQRRRPAEAGVPSGRGRPPRVAAVAIALAVLLVLAGVGVWAATRKGDTPAAARPVPAPALAGPTLAGGQLDLAALRGSVVVVNVWAAWCAPCRSELPVLVAAEHRFGPEGLRLVGLDVRDGARQARALLAQVGWDPADSVRDPAARIADRWSVRGVPETFVVDARGRIRARHVGAVTADWLARTVTPLLADTGTSGR